MPDNIARPQLATTLNSGPTYVTTVRGGAGYATGGSSFDIADTGNYAAGNVTVRVIFIPVSIPNTYTVVFDKRQVGGGQTAEISARINAAGSLQWVEVGAIYQSGHDNLGWGTFVLAVPNELVIVRNLQTAQVIAFLNGAQIGSYASATGVAAVAGAPLSFGHDYSGAGSGNGDNKYITCQVWNRALSVAEVQAIYADPYPFLVWPEDDIFSLMTKAAAAGAAWTPVNKNQRNWLKRKGNG